MRERVRAGRAPGRKPWARGGRREIAGRGRDREGGAQAEYLVDGRMRSVVRCGRPGGEAYLGCGQVRWAVTFQPVGKPAPGGGECVREGVPGIRRRAGDVERPVGQDGDTLYQRAAYTARHGVCGEAAQWERVRRNGSLRGVGGFGQAQLRASLTVAGR